MKKIILAAVAASVVAAPAAASHGYSGHAKVVQVQTKKVVRNNGRVVVKTKKVVRNQKRNWRKGQRFDSRYAYNYRVITNPRAYRLNHAPRGYRWVRSGDDAVMVAITSGIIGAVLANIF